MKGISDMPTVVKRGTRYLARVRKQGFAPVSRTFTKRADARTWGRRVEADMEAGRWVERPQEVPTLSVAIGEYRLRVAVHLKGSRDYGYSFKELEVSSLAARPVD
ncbi:MAG TPA: hypothetical protein VLE94_15955, partial [Burkholderiaceae bacterium]|nr:hypothetical protein [Burkholderiaceae bacterium]